MKIIFYRCFLKKVGTVFVFDITFGLVAMISQFTPDLTFSTKNWIKNYLKEQILMSKKTLILATFFVFVFKSHLKSMIRFSFSMNENLHVFI